MSLGLSRFCSVRVLAVLTFSLLLVRNSLAADKPHGRPIEFSDPKSTEYYTNLNQLGPKRARLRELEESDLSKSFQESFSSRGSLDGVIVPPNGFGPSPVIQIKKVKELLEQKKNWALSNPEDLTRGPTMEEILQIPEYGPDGKEKKPRSAVETYYGRQDRSYGRQDRDRREETDRSDRDDEDLLSKEKRRDLSDELEPKDETAVSVELKEDERGKLRSVFDPKPGGTALPFAPESGRGSLPDFFGLGNSTSSPGQVDAHKDYMKRFGELLPSTQTEAPSSLSGLFSDSRLAAPMNPLQSFPTPNRPSVFDTSPSSFSSPLAPASVLPDVSGGSPNSWSSPSLVPRMELPKVISPSVGDFPRRKF